MTYTQDEVDRIDQRIRMHRRRTEAMGTVISRDTTGPGAMVRHDGADTETPALVPGSVFAQPGDWVTLDLYGTQWIVTNCFSAPGFGEASRFYDALPASTGSSASTSYIDVTQFEPIVFSKFHDITTVRMQLTAGGFISGTADTEVAFALRFTPTEGGTGYTPTDITIVKIFHNLLSQHLSATGMRRISSIPAGTYTVSVRRRRSGGSGTFTSNADDMFSLELDERVRSSAPVL